MRKAVEREADFYGSMDGAGKFVKGDAMAAIVIMIVNVVGGITIGVLMKGMTVGDALNTYAILSIGNGLMTTLPAFLMSTAMGMVVSRAASEANLGSDIVEQVTAQPGALKLAAGFMALGLKKGEKVALISEGRNKWLFSELGILYAGGVDVPLSFKLESDYDLTFRINHSDSKWILVSGNHLPKIRAILHECPDVEKVIVCGYVKDF
jgi:hypothetical protein